jgi:hypothetical protein
VAGAGEDQREQKPKVRDDEGHYEPRGSGEPKQDGRPGQPFAQAALDEIPPLDLPLHLVDEGLVRCTVGLAVNDVLQARLEFRQVDRSIGEHTFCHLENAALEVFERAWVIRTEFHAEVGYGLPAPEAARVYRNRLRL